MAWSNVVANGLIASQYIISSPGETYCCWLSLT